MASTTLQHLKDPFTRFMVRTASSLVSRVISAAGLTDLTSPTPVPAYVVSLAFSPQPSSPVLSASLWTLG